MIDAKLGEAPTQQELARRERATAKQQKFLGVYVRGCARAVARTTKRRPKVNAAHS
jgi:hypothetical protein